MNLLLIVSLVTMPVFHVQVLLPIVIPVLMLLEIVPKLLALVKTNSIM